MFKNGEMKEIEIAQNFIDGFSGAKKIEFKDAKRGYALRLNFTGKTHNDKYNLWVNGVDYNSLGEAEEL